MRRFTTPGYFFCIAAALAFSAWSCSVGPSTDSETHWLQLCEIDSNCGSELRCICNQCSLPCEDDCETLPGDVSCVPVDREFCEVESGAMCLASCDNNDDCGGGLVCHQGYCEASSSFEVGEPEPTEPPEPTLPRIAVDIDCAPGEGNRNTLCDWALGADVMLYGTLEELVIIEWDEEGPGDPVISCDASTPTNMRMTIAVEEVLHGAADETVEIYLRSTLTSSWYPFPTCNPDDPPNANIWGSWNNQGGSFEDGEGPLQPGQHVGIAAYEHENGYLYNLDETNPLFVERDDSLALQTGAYLYCDVLRISQELQDLRQGPFQDFVDTARACSEAGEIECPNTLLGDGESCPVGCHDFPNRIEAYDIGEDCRIDEPTFCLDVHQSLVEGDDAIGCWVHETDQTVVLTSIYLTTFTTEIDEWSTCEDWDGWDDEAQMNRYWHENTEIGDCVL